MTAPVVAIFLLTYALIATRRLSILPIGRPAGALLGAVLMVAVGALTPAESYAAIDHDTIVLLFAMMVLSVYLDRAGFFAHLSRISLRACRTPAGLLTAFAIAPGLLSAFLVNDAVCLFLTPFVVSTCMRERLPPSPYLIALATSANIGSAMTLVGNPQNMIVGSLSDYAFVSFMLRAAPASLAGLAINGALLHLYYRRALPRAFASAGAPEQAPSAAANGAWPRLTATVVALVVAGFFAGFHLGYTVLAGVMVLVLADRREPEEALARVDWSLLVFFCCLFIVVEGLATTGLVDRAWEAAAPHASLHAAPGLAAFASVLAVGSNVFSNVPMVLLTGPHLDALGDPERGWVLLAFVTTVAGNLTLVGSVANLIVAEQAKEEHELGFVEYTRFGFVSTVLVLAAGVPLVCLMT